MTNLRNVLRYEQTLKQAKNNWRSPRKRQGGFILKVTCTFFTLSERQPLTLGHRTDTVGFQNPHLAHEDGFCLLETPMVFQVSAELHVCGCVAQCLVPQHEILDDTSAP